MNKKDNRAFWKEKSFYVSLVTGGIAMAAVVAVCLNVFSDDTLEEVVPYQSMEPNQTTSDSGERIEIPELEQAESENGEGTLDSEVNLLEQDIMDPIQSMDPVQSTDPVQPSAEPLPSSEPITEPASVNTNPSSRLSFDAEKGLLWPVSGDVILNYSMENSVYFETLGQYKCNPGVMIGAKEGTKVLSATDAIVTEITENEEIGTIVKTSIGEDYTLLYGQLKDVKVSEGDTLKEGDVIGVIAQPTKYYVMEGSNLYFQVNQKEETVNPMLLLR